MQNISSLEQMEKIRSKVEAMSKHTQLIHVTVNNKRIKIKEAPSTITGIYNRFLCVESQVNHYIEKFTIHYIDLLTGAIHIKEL